MAQEIVTANNVSLQKNAYGYYEIQNKPTEKELEEYYRTKYYQNGLASYDLSYTTEEIQYFNNKIREKVYVISKFMNVNANTTVIDVGCGEGWVLKYFKEQKIQALGLDYSSFGCEKFNADCMNNFMAGDIYRNLQTIREQGRKFDIVWLDNVLEHVLDPQVLLTEIHEILNDKGVLMVEVPNDFSMLQNHLMKTGAIDREFWVAYPDHLSYFCKDGLEKLASASGYRQLFSMGDYPIDINLLNPNSNYVRNKQVGKSCYRAKVEFENLLHQNDLEKVIQYYKSLIDLGLGRLLISFFTKA